MSLIKTAALMIVVSFVMPLRTFPQDQNPTKQDPIAQKLDAAILASESSIIAAKDILLSAIDVEIVTAESKKNLRVERKIALIDDLKAAKARLNDSDLKPTNAQLQAHVEIYSRSLQRARDARIKAYDKAVEEYGETVNIEAAKLIIKARDEYKSSSANSPGVFAAGSRFLGTRSNAIAKTTSPFGLEIITNQNGKISGKVYLEREDRQFQMDGLCKNNEIEFSIKSNKDFVEQSYKGKLVGNDLELSYEGTPAKGGRLYGEVRAQLLASPKGRTK